MKLRFQESDAVDEEVRKQRQSAPRMWLVFIVPFTLVFCVWGIVRWLLGTHFTLHRVGTEAAWMILPIIVGSAGDYFLTPIYLEFRLRTKEMDGKLDELVAQNARLLGRIEALSDAVRNLSH